MNRIFLWTSTWLLVAGCTTAKENERHAASAPSHPQPKASPDTPSGNGNEVGNGGDVLVCEDAAGNVVSVRLLDYYESQEVRNLTPAMDAGDSPTATALGVIDRLATLDAARRDQYKNAIDAFLENSAFVTEVTLPHIEDTGSLILPNGCKVQQVAIQHVPKVQFDKRYTIDQDLWDKLDDVNKAGLILHEVIYTDGIARGLTTSPGVRYFNSVLASNAVASMSADDYARLLSQVRLDEVSDEDALYVFRYYPGKTTTLTEARDFCAKQSGGQRTVLWDGTVNEHPDTGAISRTILGTDGQSGRALWSEDIHYGTITNYNTVIYAQDFQWMMNPESDSQGVLCKTYK